MSAGSRLFSGEAGLRHYPPKAAVAQALSRRGLCCFLSKFASTLRGMRLLDRYFLRELLIPFVYCLCGLFVFWLTFNLLDDLEDFQKANLAAADVGIYYLHKLPELLVVVVPVALLLAMMHSLTSHSRHNEFIAVRAAGVGVWRFSAVYCVVGLIFSALLFWINESWGARGELSIAALQAQRHAEPGEKHEALWSLLSFKNHAAGRFWMVPKYNRQTTEMIEPHIKWELGKGASGQWNGWPLREGVIIELKAESGRFADGVWTFKNVWLQRRNPGQTGAQSYWQTNYSALKVPQFAETPRQLRSEIRISQLKNIQLAKEASVSLREIADYLALHPELSPEEKARLDTQYHGRLARPLRCLVVAFIAFPFGAAAGRRNAFAGVAGSVFLCFVYFVLMRFGLTLGTGGSVPPWLGAWLPNILFGGAAGLMIARMR